LLRIAAAFNARTTVKEARPWNGSSDEIELQDYIA